MDSIRDALSRTDDGRVLIAVAKQAKDAVHERFVAMDELCCKQFIQEPRDRREPWNAEKGREMFSQAAARIRQLAAKGGREYDLAMHALENTWADKLSYEYACLEMTPDERLTPAQRYTRHG
jgi:hypothetical protein